MSSNREQLVGNRLALVGAVVYLLEWVVIIPFGNVGPASLGTKPAEIVATYAAHPSHQELFASWFSVVLLGRIAFAVGVGTALRPFPRLVPLADFAVGAMIVSVILEIAAYAVAASAGWLAHHGGDTSSIVALDGAANWLYQIIFAPISVFVAASSFAMWRSRVFPSWLCWLGLAAGAVGATYGAVSGPAFAGNGTFHDLGNVAQSLAMLGFWIWMLATGILLWRRVPRTRLSQ